MHYYGTRLSENISRREPEGYLLCLNVPVARTGSQEYLSEELGLTARSDLIPVFRPESEVFAPETLASFEGMPVTNDHPPEGVDVSNIRALQKGHAHNIRRGSGEEADLLLADLIITDPVLIDLILSGKREISCGYTYELCNENGRYIQRKIRGNHVAVVDAGRAGSRVSIKDHKPDETERSKTIMKKSLSKILARMAKDGDIETVAEIIEEMIEPEAAVPENAAAEVAEAVEEVAEEPTAVVETSEGNTIVVDEAALGEIVSRLDKIISLLTPASSPAADEDPAEEIAEAVEEVVEAVAEEEVAEELPAGTQEVDEILEEILEPETGETVSEVLTTDEGECEDPQPEVVSTGDAIRAALKAVRPALAKMPKKQRQRVCADIAARLNGKPAHKGIYAAIGDATRRDTAAGPDLGRKIMASRNPNYKK